MLLAKCLSGALHNGQWRQDYINLISGPTGECIQTTRGTQLLQQVKDGPAQAPVVWSSEDKQLTVIDSASFRKVILQLAALDIVHQPGFVSA